MVSIQATSAPPAFSPAANSANDSIAASSVSAPSGSKSSPVGPIEPATPPAGARRRRPHRPAGGPLGELEHPTLGPVQFQPVTVATEGVGQDDVGAGIDELLVQRAHSVGVVGVPELRRVARTQTTFEVVRSCGAIGEQRAAGGEQLCK